MLRRSFEVDSGKHVVRVEVGILFWMLFICASRTEVVVSRLAWVAIIIVVVVLDPRREVDGALSRS